MRDGDIYTTSQVAKAAGISLRVLRAWLDRGVVSFLPAEDLSGSGRGNYRRFSLQDAVHFAVMGRIVADGRAPANASRIVTEFSQSGDDERDPGGLFPVGVTLLVITTHADAAVTTQIAGLGDLENLSSQLYFASEAREVTHTVINLAPIVRRVEAALKAPEGADADEDTETEGGWTGR